MSASNMLPLARRTPNLSPGMRRTKTPRWPLPFNVTRSDHAITFRAAAAAHCRCSYVQLMLTNRSIDRSTIEL
jgi:hypothetical protein